MDIDMYSAYQKVCGLASLNDEVFNKFKRDNDYRDILEHVSHESGIEYIAEMASKWPLIIDKINWVSIQKMDRIGNPILYDYRDQLDSLVKMDSYLFSPTTLRYIFYGLFILSCQSKKTLNIIEIGGGHGGQCYVMHTLSPLFNINIISYTIIDIPHVIDLQKKCLVLLNTPCLCLDAFSYKTALLDSYDLCVSNYAIGELSENIQTDYINNIIKRSNKHFFIWNLTPIHPYFTDRGRIYTYNFIKERPYTGPSVVIFN